MVWVFFAIVIIILSLYLSPLLFRGAPFEPTPSSSVVKMLEIADTDQDDIVYDLGCGNGRILKTAANEFNASAVGIEISPLMYLVSKISMHSSGLSEKVEIKFGDFFKQDLSEASIVTVFQSIESNKKLRKKLENELKSGSKVISYHWKFEGWNPIKTDDEKEIYMYEIS